MRGSVLVTGGAGFIGSHACKRIAAEGWTPVTVDNLSTGHRDAVKYGPFFEVDIRDSRRVAEIMRAQHVSAVMHFAASAYVGESVQDPSKYYSNNVEGMRCVLDAAVSADVGNVVLSSSCATYGIPDTLPISEDAPQLPINPYGRTKLICEQMLGDFATAHQLRFAALRYFNACGADASGELSERHDPETHLVPIALMAASGRRPSLSVFGTDYSTPDGTCIRDYIHVEDLAEAHTCAIDHLEQGNESIAVNLGTGRGLSIFDIVDAIERVSGKKVPLELADRRPGDPPALYADPTRAKELLGFVTRRSDIDTIIRDAAPSFGLDLVLERSSTVT